jgi:hypothetical protein
MTETQAPATNAPETATQPRNSGYLPVLPEGWEYMVELHGPGGARIVVKTENLPGLRPELRLPDNALVVEVTTASRQKKTFHRPTLKEGVRAGVEAARAINVIAEHEARAQEATEKLLDTIGGEPVAADEGSSTDN